MSLYFLPQRKLKLWNSKFMSPRSNSYLVNSLSNNYGVLNFQLKPIYWIMLGSLGSVCFLQYGNDMLYTSLVGSFCIAGLIVLSIWVCSLFYFWQKLFNKKLFLLVQKKKMQFFCSFYNHKISPKINFSWKTLITLLFLVFFNASKSF